MNRTVRTKILVAAMTAGIAAASAGAQVAIRQTGQALDANPQVGSGGYNGVAGGIGGVNSQLYVNGQVSGLGSFHGSVGYYAPNQLNLALPGAGMSMFLQQSTGLTDVMGGNTYSLMPYYDQASTIWSAHGALPSMVGGAVPANSLPAVTSTPLPALPGAGSSMVYRPLSAGNLEGSGALPSFEGRTIAGNGASYSGSSDLAGTSVYRLPTTTMNPDIRRQLVEALSQQVGRNPQQIDRQVKEEVNTDASADQMVPPPSKQKAQTARENASNEPDKDHQNNPAGGEAEANVERLREVAAPQAGQDIFLDLLFRMKQQGPQSNRLPIPEPSQRVLGQDSGDSRAKPPQGQNQGLTSVPPGPPPGRASMTLTQENLVEKTATGEMILHGLAGRSNDQFNLRMSAAAKDLKLGDYEQATIDYSVAITLDSENPLARLGQGICSFAKGDYLSSAIYVRRAINLFPPIIRARLDLPAMLDPMVLKLRMATLDNRLASGATIPDPGLVFTAAFVHYQLGQFDQASNYARQLLASSGADKAYLDFAAVVVGEGTAATATSRPAGK